MDISRLKRDASVLDSRLRETPEGGLMALQECKVIIPTRFETIGLATVSVETHVVGIYALLFEDGIYAVCNVCAMMRINPSKTEKIKIENTEYYVFTIAAGTALLPNINLVRQDILTYYIYSEMLSAGKIPWYLSYNDLGSIFDTAKSHANANIGQEREITEMLVSLASRTKGDRAVFFRMLAKDPSMISRVNPAYIPLRSVIYAATNTTTKLAGSYMHQGIVGALVTPSENVERIEEILRK